MLRVILSYTRIVSTDHDVPSLVSGRNVAGMRPTFFANLKRARQRIGAGTWYTVGVRTEALSLDIERPLVALLLLEFWLRWIRCIVLRTRAAGHRLILINERSTLGRQEVLRLLLGALDLELASHVL